jgi:Raf kinase inhibitor-like YbhB/YbcL family protein
VSRAGPLIVAAAIALAGCGGSSSSSSSTASSSAASGSSTTAPTAATAAAGATTTTTNAATPQVHLAAGFHLSSPAFRAGGSIPRLYTCDGRGTSLPLRWSGVPRVTKELVLVMRDPDAPGGAFVHWAVAGIAPTTTGFPAAGVSGQVIPGRNSAGSLGYTPPCPPKGDKAHHYVLTLAALASSSGLRPGFTADQLRTRALGLATLIGTYARG